MTIDKAIEILHPYLYPNYYRQHPDLHDALLLAIEALKRVKTQRLFPSNVIWETLPGETKS